MNALLIRHRSPLMRDWKGRAYAGRDVCDAHGVVWMVRVGSVPMCEFCALGRDQTPRYRDPRRPR